MRFSRSAPTAILLSATVLASPVTLAATDVEALEQRVRVLERQLEIQKEEADTRLKTAPVVSASNKGFSVKTPDAAYELKVRGLVQLDARSFADDHSAYQRYLPL